MRYAESKVFMIGQTAMDTDEISSMLDSVGAHEFGLDADISGAEGIIEIAGRLCYKSFEPGLNKNVTRVREGNKTYIKNILKVKHGSVIEHGDVVFALIDVSRILTHELVRHRAGTAFSQESGRFVRLDEFILYEPKAIMEDLPKNICWDIMKRLTKMMEINEIELHNIMDSIPWDNLDFAAKKRLTSALRRYAPQGQCTNIIVKANHREWRHICSMRISEGAEEEIVEVQRKIAKKLQTAFPSLYQDMTFDEDGFVYFEHEKV